MIRFPSVALAAIAVCAGGCADGAGKPAEPAKAVGPAIETAFQLQAGQSVTLADLPIEIGFEAVVADSRCRKGEACVWEGDAVVRFWLQRKGGSREQRELHTASRLQNAAPYEGLTLRLVDLSPVAISGRTIPASGYVATLRLSRTADAEDRPL
jgi:hypothetical protein